MKRRRKRRKPSLQPQVTLVGNSGMISRDNRLCRLRVTKKYKNFLLEQEKEKNAKISEMSKLVEQYENSSCLIHNLNQENADNSNADLLQELKEMQTKYRERLLHLESTFMDTIPNALNRSLREILNCNSKFNKQKKAIRSGLPNNEKRELKRSTISNGNANLHGVNKMSPTDLMNSINKSDQKTNASSVSEVKSNASVVTSWSGCYKSQIFVRKSNSQLQAINIDLFSVGNNLYDVLAQELEEDVTNYNLMFGAKEVDKEKTLFEQEIYHGSTVGLILPLYGGMPEMGKKKKRHKRPKKNKEATLKQDKEHSMEETSKAEKAPEAERTPEPWTDPRVQRWFEKANEILEIDIHLVSTLKTLDDNEVNMLEKEDWGEMFPGLGHILFNMWQKDQRTSAETVGTEEYREEERASFTPLEKETQEVYDSSNDPDDSRPNVDSQEQDTSNGSRKVVFGKVEALDGIKELLLEDFENDDKSPIPHFGRVITVTGVCSSTPQIQGNEATLCIKDEAQGAVSFHNKVKIVIARCESNKHEIDILSKEINTNMHVGVKGRVEKLDKEDDVVNKDGCKMLKFKLVLDSDDHALFSVETKRPKMIRQLSHSWWPLQACSENANELNLKVGDFIVDNDLERVYCDADTSDEILLQYVVAFKNSFDGEIFVGVKKNGEITGMEVSNGEIKQWCERITKAIGNLLPESNEGADICRNMQETNGHRNRCFVCALPLCNDSCRSIGWIHVPKGEARVYFTKASDVHAFKRVGAENKRIINYQHLFYDLDSLASRQIEPAFVEEYDEEDDDQDEKKCKWQEEYKVLKEVKHENQHHELKMIFGDNPAKTILEKYLAPHACGFLNSDEGDGGNIFFGIEEDEQSKMGHIVGIVLSTEERKALVETTVKTLRNFYPPVRKSQFHIKFHSVRVPSGFIVRDKGDKMYAMITGPSDEIGKKWPKFIHKKLPGSCSAVIPIRSQRFCVVAKKQTSDGGNLTELVEQFVKNNSKFKLQTISKTELKAILENICVVELNVSRSPYPIHMIKTIDTYVFSEDKAMGLCISKLSLEDLMYRFKLDSTNEFSIHKFLEHVKNFDNAGNSYFLVASPFYFLENERDLYGLVIPKWTLTIDLDQGPKQTGHLYQLFQTLNDRYQTERDRFLKTPQDSKLDLNPDHTVCWLAARGYREKENSLSEESHAKWNKTHRSRVRDHLNKGLETSVKPNCLNVVVLWDEGHQALVESLRTILEDIISLNGDDSTVITFVCATPKAGLIVSRKIIEPLQEDNWDTISEDRVHIAPPYVLARFLSLKLPSPYRPEDDYQVPHKKFFPSGGSQIIPQILPKRLRQNLSGHVKVMYMKKGRKPDEQTLNEERTNFFSGCAITEDGLHGNIAIRRTKMDDLEKKFRTLFGDKKSHVSLIFVKVDRGAGSTTMCLQFLYEQHRSFPCAQLTEIKDGLVSLIDEMNKKTRLPLILFVDENIAHLQHFLDFKKEVERRNVNVIFILIEPAEMFSGNESLFTSTSRASQQKPRTKSARDSSLYGPSPYKEVQLKRRLDEYEMKQLVEILTEIENGKKKELLKFKENAQTHDKPLTFAQFSLVAFGSGFKGLTQYVKFRLTRADERQQNILAFLSLTHVYTNYSLPANALVHFLNKRKVTLEEELEDKYLQELLSPHIEGSDSRRISFHEVAKEILKQLSNANSGDDQYWKYIKVVSVTLAKHVLSKYITTKKIDRLTRKLFVTSEYESEKFSQLIRSMRVTSPDTARDTLKELVEVFNEKEKHSSIRAHLRAHLAKYHMIEYNDFAGAKELIEAAIHEQEQDSLLHHIHGDIIRQYVLLLVDEMEKKEEMETLLFHAVKSSECFEHVRSKRPHMSHGYISDALLRITVMQAGIKLMGGNKNISFVDYLIVRIDEIKELDEDISPNSRYLLSLISDTYDYLDERYIDFEQKEKWKEIFLGCIGDLKNLTRLCDKIEKEKNCNSFINCSAWLHEILVQTQILHHALEIENKDLSPQEIELKLKKMEEYGLNSKFGDRFMKFWIRYSRKRLSVPNLQKVKRRVNEWSNKMKKQRVASPQAEFYNFVVHVLIALKYPSDLEKMDKAEELTNRQQSKKYRKKEDFVLPLEWLHPKEGRHIESIDCLLHHDDLIKGTNISSESDKRKPIEGSLFEKNITQWEGAITAVRSDWQGTITFKGRLPVRFVPLNVQPSMPSLGDTVKFCLSFDGSGLSAWRVMRDAGTQPGGLSDIVSVDDDSSSEHSEQEDMQKEGLLVSPSLCSIYIQEPDERHGLDEQKDQKPHAGAVSKKRTKTHWDKYNEQRMQGVVLSTNPEMGFGFIENADVEDKLFFHASQLREPVKNLKGNIYKDMLLDFKVEKLTERTRAADIRVLKDDKLRESMLAKLRKKKQPLTGMRANECDTSRLEGSVEKFFVDKGYGFIKRDNDKSGNDIFFNHRNLVTRGQLPKVRDRVEFCLTKTSDGRFEATDILVQNKSISSNRWDRFVGAGIQEGFVNSTTDDGGTINNSKVTGPKSNLHFRNRDIRNKSRDVVIGTKVHFEVLKRKGRCFAVKIYVVDTPEGTPDDMMQDESGEASFSSRDF